MSERVFRLMASARKTGKKKGEVRIYSAISEWKWGKDDPTVTSNDFDKELAALGDVDEITVRINSPGGIVSEAIAIRTMLMKHKASKTVDIEGCCDSAATLIACMPGARVRIAQGGEYMIHRCSSGVWGNANRFRSVLQSMEQTDRSMSEIYAERTGKTAEECMKLMDAETWYGPKDAVENGFADEVLQADDADVPMVACAVDAETFRLMTECYAHTPDRPIKNGGLSDRPPYTPFGETSSSVKTEENELPDVSNAGAAVAAGHATEIQTKEEQNMPELRDATAEMLKAENPDLVQEIASKAVEAERARIARIDKLTPKGAKFAEMGKKAKAEGTSVEDYLEMVIAAQEQAGEDFLEARSRETAPAANVGGGDSKDNDDDKTAKEDRAAKDIAEMAKAMKSEAVEMA